MEDNDKNLNVSMEGLNSSDQVNNSELVHVNLDFNDGVTGEAFCEPAILVRLQEGDKELMEQLKTQLNNVSRNEEYSTITNMKRKPEDDISSPDEEKRLKLVNEEIITLEDLSTEQQPSTSFDEKDEKSTKKKTEVIRSLYLSQMDFSLDEKFPLKKKLKRPRRYGKYSFEDRDKATKHILDGDMSVNQAAKKFNIPSSTLFDQVTKVGGSRFKCDLCDKTFPLEHMLEKHRPQHFREHLCSYCAHNSKSTTDLRRHIFTCHAANAQVDYGDEFITYTLTHFKNAKWKTDNVLMLFSEYGKILDDREWPNSARDLWQELADRFWKEDVYISAKQIKVKWIKLINMYKYFKENGQKHRPPPYFKEVEKFLLQHHDKELDFGEDYELEEADENLKEQHLLNKTSWTEDLTVMLLDQFEEKIEQFQNPLVSNSCVWTNISKEFCSKGFIIAKSQLVKKWNALKKMYYQHAPSVDPLIEYEEEQNGITHEYALYGERLKKIINLTKDCDKESNTPKKRKKLGKVRPTLLVIKADETPEDCTSVEYSEEPENAESTEHLQCAWSDGAFADLLDQYDICLNKIEIEDIPVMNKKQMYESMAKNMQENGYGFSDMQIYHKLKDILGQMSHPTTKPENIPLGSKVMNLVKKEERLRLEKEKNTNLEESSSAENRHWSDRDTLILIQEFHNVITCKEDSEIELNELFKVLTSTLRCRGLTYGPGHIKYRWNALVREAKFLGLQKDNLQDKVQSILDKLINSENIRIPKNRVTRNIRKPYKNRTMLMGKKTASSKTDKEWPKDAIQLLIQEFSERLDDFDNVSINNQVLWSEVAIVFESKGYIVNNSELENKWTLLVQEYKAALKSESKKTTNKNKNKHNGFKYMCEMEQVIGINADLFSGAVKSEKLSDDEENNEDTEIIKKLGSPKKEKQLSECEGSNTEDYEEQLTNKPHTLIKQCVCSQLKGVVGDIVSYLEDSENKRIEQELERDNCLSLIRDEKLGTVKTVQDMVLFFKDYENKRKELEKERAKELEKSHKIKIYELKKLLKNA